MMLDIAYQSPRWQTINRVRGQCPIVAKFTQYAQTTDRFAALDRGMGRGAR